MIENIPQQQRDHIVRVLKDNDGDYEQTARELVIPPALVREVDIIENKRFNATPSGRGRPELQKYIVAIAKMHEPWNNRTKEIREARAAYEAGTHEMCQGRDGLNKILYLIPRKRKVKPRKYFSRSLEVVE